MTTNSDLYCRAVQCFTDADLPNATQFATDVLLSLRDADGPAPKPELFWPLVDIIEDIYIQNVPKDVPDPPPPELSGTIQEARWRDQVNALIVWWQNPNNISHMRLVLTGILIAFLKQCPALIGTWDEATDDIPTSDLTVPFADLYGPDVLKFWCAVNERDDLFRPLTDRLAANYYKLKTFDDYALYDGTPLQKIASIPIPVVIPQHVRFEHHLITAGSGHGKSQCLQYLISNDLEHIGERSIIVIDSQGDLIRRISRLRTFYDGPLQGRLCLIDPTDIEYPLALNIFDTGQSRLQTYTPLQREKLNSSIIELYDLVMASLLSAELTPKQEVIFRFITRLMLAIPDATIHTLRELMEDSRLERFGHHVDTLDPTAQSFFRNEFADKQFDGTRKEVLWRLYSVLENKTFERMFSHPRNRFDIFTEMNAGKVILINTAKDLLKEQGSQIFGRFFIALIAQAAQERAATHDRMPCIVYIDEAQEYVDSTVTRILEQARKYNVGLCLAHQYLGQLPQRVLESLSANTAIKMAGGVSDKDARAFASMMRCKAELIEAQPKGHFVTSIRNHLPAVPVRIPGFVIEKMPTVTEAEFSHIRNAMRAQYASQPGEKQEHQAKEQTITSSVSKDIMPDPDY